MYIYNYICIPIFETKGTETPQNNVEHYEDKKYMYSIYILKP